MVNMSSDNLTLVVMIKEKVIFQSNGKWLYPLFDLEDYLKNQSLDLKNATLFDKIVGKAAALLMTRMGAGKIHASVMSKLAMDVFEQFNTPYSYNQAVKRIQCQTETILSTITDPDEAYHILCKRAGRC
jgi:zinc transport system ATP-binding protein